MLGLTDITLPKVLVKNTFLDDWEDSVFSAARGEAFQSCPELSRDLGLPENRPENKEEDGKESRTDERRQVEMQFAVPASEPSPQLPYSEPASEPSPQLSAAREQKLALDRRFGTATISAPPGSFQTLLDWEPVQIHQASPVLPCTLLIPVVVHATSPSQQLQWQVMRPQGFDQFSQRPCFSTPGNADRVPSAAAELELRRAREAKSPMMCQATPLLEQQARNPNVQLYKNKLWCHFHLHASFLEKGFDGIKKIIGHGGCNTSCIFEVTGAKIRVRGRGSGHMEQRGREAPVPLMLAVTADRGQEANFAQAVEMCCQLLRSVAEKWLAFCARRGSLKPAQPPYWLGGVSDDGLACLDKSVLDRLLEQD